MESVPLDAQDRAILALESDVVAGHTCKVILIGQGAPGIERLRAALGERVAAVPALTRRLGGSETEPAWVPDERFDIADHVVEVGCAPLDTDRLRSEVARLFAERLDRSRALWRIDVAPLASDGLALIWRIHHALADGSAAMRHAKELLWDREPDARSATASAARQVPAATASDPASAQRERSAADAPPGASAHAPAAGGGRIQRAGALLREGPHTGKRSPLAGRIGATRAVAFAEAPLAELHDAAKRLDGATVNDAVLTVIAGALREWRLHRGIPPSTVRAKVPVSLHRDADDAGNRDSFFTIPLPLGEPDPATRLRAIHTATSARKAGHDAEVIDELARDLGLVSPRLRTLYERLERSPRVFALNISNVPGPRTPVKVLGARVRSLHSIAEIAEHHALRIAVVSLADQLGFGFCADPALVPELPVLAQAAEQQAEALTRA